MAGPRKVPIRAMVTPAEQKEFRKRCIDYDTTVAKVVRNAMKEFMRTHLPMGKNEGIV